MAFMHKAAAVVAAFFVSAAAFAATPSVTDRTKYEQVLVPMFFLRVVPGANGSLWQTEFTGRNGGATDVVAFQTAGDGIEPTILGGGQTFHIRPRRDYLNPANPGVFLYIEKERAASVTYTLRLRELSQSPFDFLEVPVVHERDFSSSTTNLLDVPTNAATRAHLRIYGASSSNGHADVIVRIFGNDAKLYEKTVTLTPAGGLATVPTDSAFMNNPAYAELANLRQLPGIGAHDIVRVEIEPVSPGLRYWSFISVTNNATQRVSTITPQ